MAQKEKKVARPIIKVLITTTEAFPYAGTGGLGEVCGSLPKALGAHGVDARVIMPFYSTIPARYREKAKYLGNIRVWVGWRNQYCGLFEHEVDGVTTYFVDNEYYFKRDGIYGYGDDCERFAFFSRAVLECLWTIGFFPDIIHSNDHATALVPVFYKHAGYADSDGYPNIKQVFTVHNLEYQGWYPMHLLGDVLGMGEDKRGVVDFNNEINCVKAAIESADVISTVSPTYAKEILMPEHACGLVDILERHRGKLVGILNGINTNEYDPAESPFIAQNYGGADMSGKRACKTALLRELGLPQTDRPIIAIISRLAGHKGIDIVRDDLCRENNAFAGANLVVLGTGDKQYEDFFDRYASCHGNARALIKFDKALAQRIYAGADMFLMPSAAEPCGLSQMMACRYATVPIVRATGGLADSIFDCRSGGGNGFTFGVYNADALDHTVGAAIQMYADKKKWNALMSRCIACDFSWNASAAKYRDMYERLL